MPKHKLDAKKRLYHVTGIGLALLSVGILYGVFVKKTGWGIPCIFHLITGLKCPGCGVTRMFVALLGGDVRGAFEANPAVLILSPVFLWVFITYVAGYVKTGIWRLGRLQNGAVWLSAVVLIGYGIGRNILSL